MVISWFLYKVHRILQHILSGIHKSEIVLILNKMIKISVSDTSSFSYIWIAAQTPDTLSICPHVTKDRDFAIIGHAGGDPYRGCENTLEATRIALARSLSSTLKIQNRAQQNTSKGSVIYLTRLILVHRTMKLLQKV